MRAARHGRVRWFAAGPLLLMALVAPPARAQAGADCAGELAAAEAAQRRQCEAHGPCRQVLRAFETCAPLRAFLGHLATLGPGVDDAGLRRALVDSGVPANGLASCTKAFNRALCRQFLGADAPVVAAPRQDGAREPLLLTEARRLLEQLERARRPADAHRFAELKLAMCAQARQPATRETQCHEAQQAVAACRAFRADWERRRDALAAEAERLGLEAVLRQTPRGELAACASTLPQSGLTPAQALAHGQPQAPAPRASEPAAPASAAELAPTMPPPAPAPRLPAPPVIVGPPGARSLCLRNAEKAGSVVRAANAPLQAAAFDLVVLELHRLVLRLLEPCASWDADTRFEAERRRAGAELIRRRCAGEHGVLDCTPWGEHEAGNRRHFELWRAEVGKSMVDPEYSADLGPARAQLRPKD